MVHRSRALPDTPAVPGTGAFPDMSPRLSIAARCNLSWKHLRMSLVKFCWQLNSSDGKGASSFPASCKVDPSGSCPTQHSLHDTGLGVNYHTDRDRHREESGILTVFMAGGDVMFLCLSMGPGRLHVHWTS